MGMDIRSTHIEMEQLVSLNASKFDVCYLCHFLEY